MTARFAALRLAMAKKPHGTRQRYIGGCHCDECRAANRRYEKERTKRRRWGDWNGLVDVGRVRRHLLRLSAQGVGYKQVASAAGVAPSILAGIRAKRRENITARNERRVLAVDRQAIADRALVDARKTWRMIERLRDFHGFTNSELARRLGSRAKVPALQIGKHRVTALTESRVERLLRRYE